MRQSELKDMFKRIHEFLGQEEISFFEKVDSVVVKNSHDVSSDNSNSQLIEVKEMKVQFPIWQEPVLDPSHSRGLKDEDFQPIEPSKRMYKARDKSTTLQQEPEMMHQKVDWSKISLRQPE